MKLLTSILGLTAIAGVSAMPTSNSATTNTITSGEFTYNGEGVDFSLQCSGGINPPHADCEPGKCQCRGDYGCWSCQGGRMQCQPGPGSGTCWT
ncbi:hypothetical protein BDV32DRAFT_115778 [Aspergillus pseudonomiae]|uniref:Uncharacterized protein n=1 Tax=Aspergillus pseudonomiae TaxID=1506151 RepID=A0A5N6IH09_9EURO|nr:uncharacterized protein BDV37DRAFT_281608 [Aspergillus pseudonomiae]KAB8265728.1 hypothetical protein BDV32DRAFT_115778 [Aspergillus pseudonomiae]KAE8405775.1 hypothetical protein BDV37DRAFT_281608 [Aspergillus pseudonomiae]